MAHLSVGSETMKEESVAWSLLRHWMTIFLLWLFMWMCYVYNNYMSASIAHYISDYGAHLYRNASILLVYALVSREFMRMYYYVDNKLAAWKIGMLWAGLSILSDFFFWKTLYHLDFTTMLKPFFIWEGSLYPIQLTGLFAAPIFAHRMQRRRDYFERRRQLKRLQRAQRPDPVERTSPYRPKPVPSQETMESKGALS